MLQHTAPNAADDDARVLVVGEAFTTYWAIVGGSRVSLEVHHAAGALLTYTSGDLTRFCIDVEEVPDVVAVPPVVSRLQAKMALNAAGLLDEVEAAVAGASAEVRIYWAEASHLHRDHAVIEAMRVGLGWTNDQVDDLFTAAFAIT